MKEILSALARAEKFNRDVLAVFAVMGFLPFAAMAHALISGFAREEGALIPMISVAVMSFPVWFISVHMIIQKFIRSRTRKKARLGNA